MHAERLCGWRLELVLVCEPVCTGQSRSEAIRPAGLAARFVMRTTERDAAAMGYFALVAVCTLKWLGYAPMLPTGVLIAVCVVYVAYDTFKR
jgi:hypothetical protein